MTDHRRTLTFAEIFDLPLTLDVRTTAAAFGVSRSTIYRLIQDGSLPVPVLRFGRRYRVSTALALRALGIERCPLDPEDVSDGAQEAASWKYTQDPNPEV